MSTAQNEDLRAIDRLPDEILGAIFLLNTVKELQGENLIHDPFQTTISTCLVRKRWHSVAVDYPVLWSHIIDYEKHTPECIEELLRRSQSSPIVVGDDSVLNHVRLWNLRGKTVLRHIFQHASNLRMLNLKITVSPWDLICEQFLQYPAPALEYLNLVTSTPFPDVLYPGPLFAYHAPLLRRLRLQRCLIDFSSPVLSNLTELSVMDILAPPIMSMRKPDHPLKVAPTVEGWLRILEQIPSLRYLTLSNAITHTTNEEASTPRIDLPNLLFLTVDARFPDGAAFLNHLSIPPSCGVRLKFMHDRSSVGIGGDKLLSFLSDRLSYWPQDTPDRYLQAKILTGDRVHFGNSRRIGYIWDMKESAVVEEHALTSSDSLVWLVLSFNNSEDSLRFFNQLLLLYGLTYPTTTTLDLWIDEEFNTTYTTVNGHPSSPFLDTLYSFPAVKNLNLLGRSPLYLLPLLQAASSPGHPIFPSLRSLRLTRTNFEEEQRSVYSIILVFLQWRDRIHMALAELQIIEGRITPETLDFLAFTGNVRIMLGSPSLTAEDNSSEDGG